MEKDQVKLTLLKLIKFADDKNEKSFPKIIFPPAILCEILKQYYSHCDENWTFKRILVFLTLLGDWTAKFPNLLTSFTEKLLSTKGSPFTWRIKSDEPKSKRAKIEDDDFLKPLLILMRIISPLTFQGWDSRDFIRFFSSPFPEKRWLSVECTRLILKLSDTQTRNLKEKLHINNEYDLDFCLMIQKNLELLSSFDTIYDFSNFDKSSSTSGGISRYSPSLITVDGLVFNCSEKFKQEDSSLIPLPSNIKCLKEILLHTSSNSNSISLIGSIGCGKTLLLKSVGALFGRNSYPEITFIQMSEQIDGKLLLGSYHSTDIPGQFVWKAGFLTEAVLKGHWIVLEDYNLAPTDVVVLINELIESKRLTVPGYGEIFENFHPNFRIFSTWTIHSKNEKKDFDEKIGKGWTRVFVQSPSLEEYTILLKTLYPNLREIVEKIIDMFNFININHGKGRNRVLTLRDLLRFCSRIPENLDLSKSASAVLIFQEAFDIFAASNSSLEEKLKITEIIGRHLNLLKAKSEFFCLSYKPQISFNVDKFSAGRYTLPIGQEFKAFRRESHFVFSLTKKSACLLEMISGGVRKNESILLIGETGVGKTSAIQYLSKVLNQKMVVVNLSRQSDSADLLGGYKPVELKQIFGPIREKFESLFKNTFSEEDNSKFLTHVMTCFANKRWNDLMKLMLHVKKRAESRLTNKNQLPLLEEWNILGHRLNRLDSASSKSKDESPFAFSFIEGTLIEAVKNGYWILLDEINLASPEMLQCLSGILDKNMEIHLWEKDDSGPINRNANFRLFAAMNPSTDVGKRNLPLGIRNRFTEFFVEELTEPEELRILISDYLKELTLSPEQINNLVVFYLKMRQLETLVDGTGKRPHYSLRTLCRALRVSALNLYGSINRSLYESFCISFLTQLDQDSHTIVKDLIARYVFGKKDVKNILNQAIPEPTTNIANSKQYINVENFWIPKGNEEPKTSQQYILTASIRRNLKDLARIVSAGKLPVLIQGETSVGKTSLIEYLAQITGNKCFRINNHQHTDLQEYIGSYQCDEKGKLLFVEGILVQAMRSGDWIILDELNLAPSEVLEALNRLLDDNRQLFISETGITITAHPRFMIFATQNPPGLYGGRKALSKAFKNRFVELHFSEIPTLELEKILHLRCEIPQSYCKKIIEVLKELQIRRKSSAALQGKYGFATLRDLFRWAERYRLSGDQTARFYDWDQHLADEGYIVLAGKVRKNTEEEIIRQVLEKQFKRSVKPENLFSLHQNTSSVTKNILEKISNAKTFKGFEHIVWTFDMRRLAVLIGKAIEFKEPLLLVGETGTGKTTIVQFLSCLFDQPLYTVNCHQNSEGSDFLGGMRPSRNKQSERLFEWVDGPLIEAMERGGVFLADEISLADDSVLERINSLLEPERTLLIAEKGDETPSTIIASDPFRFIGTMNPGGDYGKKELSPALRNRLTEIWTQISGKEEDIKQIIEHNLCDMLKNRRVSEVIVAFVSWLRNNDFTKKIVITIRDYLTWTQFLNISCNENISGYFSLPCSIYHGACLTFLDSIGTGVSSYDKYDIRQEVHFQAVSYLESLLNTKLEDVKDYKIENLKEKLSIGPFQITKNILNTELYYDQLNDTFKLESPTTKENAIRIIRALQLSKPILLEGSPGVGKTALVTSLAAQCGFSLVRINLSEQTDISDLFGADLPSENSGRFEWKDGPLLQALKSNCWILLDEMNLASQSVLEGLNACLDHRGEIFVPELNRKFKIESRSTRIFACQNPVRQGGARKGLPKSFLNRFIQVYMESLSKEDLRFVLQSNYPAIPVEVVEKMVLFNQLVHENLYKSPPKFGLKGSPWDFNLRDLLRWADLLCIHEKITKEWNPANFIDLLYGIRMRSLEDRKIMSNIFENNILINANANESKIVNVPQLGESEIIFLEDKIICGSSTLKRAKQDIIPRENLLFLQRQKGPFEAVCKCLEMGWMPIIVGKNGTGKTSIVKQIAQYCGRKLSIMSPSPEMDTIEILGGFEQADIYRQFDAIHLGLTELISNLLKSLIVFYNGEFITYINEGLNLWTSIKKLKEIKEDNNLDELKIVRTRLCYLKQNMEKYSTLKNKLMNISTVNHFFLETADEEDLKKELEDIEKRVNSGLVRTGAFQWVESVLINALQKGNWLVIKGANRCSSSVLDRLNSLMEPNGTLLLSERGEIDGKILEIKPHRDFRLILTINPSYGEISRAMRNRGIEIFMHEIEESQNVENEMTLVENFDSESELENVGLREKFQRKALLKIIKFINSELKGNLRIDNKNLIQFGKSLVLENESSKISLNTVFNLLLIKFPDSFAELDNNIVQNLIDNLNVNDDNNLCWSERLPLTLRNYINVNCLRGYFYTEILNKIKENDLLTKYQTENVNFNDFLIASIYSRIRPQDINIVDKIIQNKYQGFSSSSKEISELLSNLLNGPEFLTDLPWDGKWTQLINIGQMNFTKICQISLLIHEKIIAQDIKLDSLNFNFSKNDLVIHFWNLASQFRHILKRGIVNTEFRFTNSYENEELWYSGMKSFLWIERFYNLGALITDHFKNMGSKNLSENLESNLSLLNKYIEVGVVPILKEFSPIEGCELEKLLNNFKSEDTSTQLGNTFREIVGIRPFKRNSNEEFIQQILGLYYSLWWNAENCDDLYNLFTTNSWRNAYQQLLNYFSNLLNNEMSCEDEDLKLFLSFKEELDSIKKSFKIKKQEDECENEVLKVSKPIVAIQEIEKLSNSQYGLLTSPLLISAQSNYLYFYMKYEENTKFCKMFNLRPSTLLEFSSSLPYFSSEILIDKNYFRVSSLKNRGSLDNSLKTLQDIFSVKFLTEIQTSKNILMKEIKNIENILNGLSIFTNIDIIFKNMQQIKHNMESSSSLNLNEEVVCQLGNLLIETSCYFVEICASLPLVDPSVENEFAMCYLSQEDSFFKSWLLVQQLRDSILKGESYSQNNVISNQQQQHPFVLKVQSKIVENSEKLKKAEKKIALRSSPPKYKQIRGDIRQFCFTFIKRMNEIKISYSGQSIIQGEIEGRLDALENWIDTINGFNRKLIGYFFYWDVILPFLFSISLGSIGVKLICHSMKMKNTNLNTRKKYTSLLKFPLDLKRDFNKMNNSKELLNSAILSFSAELKVEGSFSREKIKCLDYLSREICKYWTISENEKTRKKEIEDALYILKGRERKLDLTEDEADEKDLRDIFPNFESDFDEKTNSDEQTKENDSNSYLILSDRDIDLFFRVYDSSMQIVKNQWISSQIRMDGVNESDDFIKAFMHKYEKACTLINQNKEFLSIEDEAYFMPGSIITLKYYQTAFQQDGGIYDFYHDQNISEADKLSPVFNGLRTRTNQLLEEWPEHPALNKIIFIMNRIETFKVNSSLYKFLQGLELLLNVTQDWESVAHKGVSLSFHLAEITNLIICWRKMELHFWKNLLDITHQKEENKSRKWWFHLYPLVMDAATNTNLDKDEKAFLKSLNLFIESSTLGEFETRLTILRNLHCHLIVLEQNGLIFVNESIYAHMWNILCFYTQFLSDVKAKINSYRNSIEKKIKDFVKLSRWNDSSFYSLKDSIAKSQKNLTKLVKEFKSILSVPVSTVLIEDLTKLEVENSKAVIKKQKKKKNKNKKEITTANYILPSSLIIESEGNEFLRFSKEKLKKIGKYFNKARDIVDNSLKSESHSENIENIDEFTKSLVETAHSLQSLEAGDKLEGEKRRKALHNIHNRKRAALADLFKVLQEDMKLSYRKGLINLKKWEEFSHFDIEPLDIKAAWTLLPQNENEKNLTDEDLLFCWEGCDSYFQKCISRIAAMNKSFQNPSKELGPQILERCKGFISDLLTITCDQKKKIAKFSSFIWNFRVQLDLLNEEIMTDETLIEDLLKETFRIEYFTNQNKILVNSLANFENSPILQKLAAVLEICGIIKNNLKFYIEIEKLPSVNQYNNCVIGLEDIARIYFNFSESEVRIGSHLSHLFNKMSQEIVKFIPSKYISEENHQNYQEQEWMDKFESLAVKIVNQILLCIQRLQKESPPNKENEINEETDSSSSNSIKIVEISELNLFEEQVLTDFKNLKEIGIRKKSALAYQIINSLQPLIKQYLSVGQFYLTKKIKVFRSTTKLHSILIAIFTNLGQKGFCLPPDYDHDQDKMEGEELDAKGGFGLSNDELTSDAKDVSERFESEDQLEETKFGRDEPADKNEDDEEDVAEDDNGIEMSENFDGKAQDKKSKEKDEDDDDNDKSDDENELDKEFGDVEDCSSELDEKLWGGSSDEEEDDEDGKEKTKDSENDKGKGVEEENEIGAKENDLETGKNDENENNKDKKKEKEKDLNDEENINDDQIDPYHGNFEPEDNQMEDFELPEDLNLDGGEKNDEEGKGEEENPFDLDKENEDQEMMDEDKKEEGEEDEDGKNENEIQEEEKDKDNRGEMGLDVNIENLQEEEEEANDNKNNNLEEDIENQENNSEEKEDEEIKEDKNLSELPVDSKSNETSEPSEVNPLSKDQTTAPTDKKDNKSIQESVEADSKEESENPGQSVNENQGETSLGEGKNKNSNKNEKEIEEKSEKKKPGHSDSKRTLDETASIKDAKKLKTIENQNSAEENANHDKDAANEAEVYEHIESARKDIGTLTIDSATNEQAETQKNKDKEEEKNSEENPQLESDDENNEEKENEDELMDDNKEMVESSSKILKILNKEDKEKLKSEEEEEEGKMDIDIEGETVLTLGAERPLESNFYTNFSNEIKPEDNNSKLETSADPTFEMEEDEDMIVSSSSTMEWNELEYKIMPLAQELCEQLRLILEPTLAARLKGDYKTGKRLNMRKVIPYIASGFRKDKIWLRRTKPSKRDYQILLALDDSASMSDNKSKQMAFSAVAVVAKSLQLLESGQLGVLSFGEEIKLIHSFDENLTDGGKLIEKFTFTQQRTRIAQLLTSSISLFAEKRNNSSAEVAQLLIIISDGRGVYHEGCENVKRAVRRARDENIFIVFIIVDNPENRDSILDIRLPIFNDVEKTVQICKYLDHFPFPFYLILRDLNSLPLVLTDALRQWFDLVTTS